MKPKWSNVELKISNARKGTLSHRFCYNYKVKPKKIEYFCKIKCRTPPALCVTNWLIQRNANTIIIRVSQNIISIFEIASLLKLEWLGEIQTMRKKLNLKYENLSILFRDGRYEYDIPVSTIPDKTKVWILIRHAAPFLQRNEVNCVELLMWSQVNPSIHQLIQNF